MSIERKLHGQDNYLAHMMGNEINRAIYQEGQLGKRIDSIGASDERLKEFSKDDQGRSWVWKYNMNADGSTEGGMIDGKWHRGKTAQEWEAIDDSYVTTIGDSEYLKVETLAIVGDHEDRLGQCR